MRGAKEQRGVALLLALLTMVLLSVIVTEFTFSTQVDYRRAAIWVTSRRAALIADGGVTLAMEVLRQDFSFSNTDSLADFWAKDFPRIDTGAGMLSLRIEDEQSRLNLNGLATGALSPPGRQFATLLSQLGLDPALVSPLADWVDRNQSAGPGALAAENEWYSGLKPPYQARNGPLRSYAELALVRGFTPEVLGRLRRFVTVLPDADTRVNVNTAPPEVLAVVDPRMGDSSLIRRIVEMRLATPFTSAASLRAIGGLEAFSDVELDRLFSYASRWFRVRSTGDVDGALRSVEALLRRDNGVSKVVYLLPRRGPNIVGVDTGISARLGDTSFLGAQRR